MSSLGSAAVKGLGSRIRKISVGKPLLRRTHSTTGDSPESARFAEEADRRALEAERPSASWTALGLGRPASSSHQSAEDALPPPLSTVQSMPALLHARSRPRLATDPPPPPGKPPPPTPPPPPPYPPPPLDVLDDADARARAARALLTRSHSTSSADASRRSSRRRVRPSLPRPSALPPPAPPPCASCRVRVGRHVTVACALAAAGDAAPRVLLSIGATRPLGPPFLSDQAALLASPYDVAAPTEWYYVGARGECHGPLRTRQLRRRMDKGEVLPHSWVWAAHLERWCTVDTLRQAALLYEACTPHLSEVPTRDGGEELRDGGGEPQPQPPPAVAAAAIATTSSAAHGGAAGWFYLGAEGTSLGPVSLDRVREMVREGALTHDSLVWASHLPTWASVREALPSEDATPAERPTTLSRGRRSSRTQQLAAVRLASAEADAGDTQGGSGASRESIEEEERQQLQAQLRRQKEAQDQLERQKEPELEALERKQAKELEERQKADEERRRREREAAERQEEEAELARERLRVERVLQKHGVHPSSCPAAPRASGASAVGSGADDCGHDEADEWFYVDHLGERAGPVTALQVRRMTEEGTLSVDHLVWATHLPEWRSIRQLGLHQTHASAAAAPPAAPLATHHSFSSSPRRAPSRADERLSSQRKSEARPTTREEEALQQLRAERSVIDLVRSHHVSRLVLDDQHLGLSTTLAPEEPKRARSSFVRVPSGKPRGAAKEPRKLHSRLKGQPAAGEKLEDSAVNGHGAHGSSQAVVFTTEDLLLRGAQQPHRHSVLTVESHDAQAAIGSTFTASI
ncbi:hypothetical protein AB1Y20_017467 [Prymnesium parvum]|uniref:GYF domain-containing protein n=1 Tax=Prymnesium parvum TaxID=97485 RepID=A0AB34JKL7_PRYPA